MRIITFILLLTSTLNSQIKAVTENGDEVILYDNNSWVYKNQNSKNNLSLSNSVPTYSYDKSSTFLIKSNKIKIGIYIDPKKWKFNKSLSDDSEYEFELKNEELFGMMINEKIEMSLENLKDSAFYNFDFAASDARIVNQELRNINGLSVLMLHMEGTIDGFSVFYYGYYFSNDQGTVQLIAYSTTNLYEYYKVEIEKFLNGLFGL